MRTRDERGGPPGAARTSNGHQEEASTQGTDSSTQTGRLPSVSVVVATRGRGPLLAGFIDAALADPATTELIVVLDGPDQETFDRCTRLARSDSRLVVIPGEHRGQAGSLEVGLLRATSDVVLLSDDDVVFGPGLVAGHARRHAGRSGIVVVGSMPVEASPSGYPDGGRRHVGTVLYSREYDAHCDSIDCGELAVLDGLWGGNVSLLRSDCLRVGVSSVAFPLHYHADQDFGLRLAGAGLLGVYDPALAAVHRHHCDDARFLRSSRQQGASLMVLHRVHADRLGSFDRDRLVTDLPRPLRSVVVIVGSSARATTAARLVLATGSAVGRASGRAELVLAKLARRIMMWHGTVAGQGPPTAVAQRGVTSSARGTASPTPEAMSPTAGAVPA
ncbi:MAG: glycosyltransferase [Acidimicrobiales bacterium]